MTSLAAAKAHSMGPRPAEKGRQAQRLSASLGRGATESRSPRAAPAFAFGGPAVPEPPQPRGRQHKPADNKPRCPSALAPRHVYCGRPAGHGLLRWSTCRSTPVAYALSSSHPDTAELLRGSAPKNSRETIGCGPRHKLMLASGDLSSPSRSEPLSSVAAPQARKSRTTAPVRAPRKAAGFCSATSSGVSAKADSIEGSAPRESKNRTAPSRPHMAA
mmetsp:Transcript_108567/g.312764  ORF Transcript_108567/g.312764 Transcript_108567/m.312764 type:complete len:217 (-) Transcript_108567:2035-2685(-)